MLRKLYNWASTWTGTIVIVLGVIFFAVQAFVIPSGSMKNSLLIGDMLFVKKFTYGVPIPRIPWMEIPLLPDFNNNGHLIEGDKPKRGDIVVFRYPNDDKVHYVKRAVAVGGDLIAVSKKHLLLKPHEGDEFIKKNYPKENITTLNGKLWVIDPYRKNHPGIHNDPNVIPNLYNPEELFHVPVTKVPEGEYFMMGDNRDHSNDSRFWGTVKYRYIVGTPWLVYFSLDKNKVIRWDRMFKTVKTLEENAKTNLKKLNHIEGIY